MERLENVTGKLDFPVTIGGKQFQYTHATSTIDHTQIGRIFVCSENPTKHVFSITEQQQKKFLKTMKKDLKVSGTPITLKTTRGQVICSFKNMLVPKSAPYIDDENKFPCFGCLDNKTKKFPIERIILCMPVENAYKKEKKRRAAAAALNVNLSAANSKIRSKSICSNDSEEKKDYIPEPYTYRGKVYTSGKGRSSISNEPGAYIYGCSNYADHMYNLTDKEYKNIHKEIESKMNGDLIVIKNHLNEPICSFYNMMRRKTKERKLLDKKPFCLGCLNMSEHTDPIESIQKGILIEEGLSQHRKKIEKERKVREREKKNDLKNSDDVTSLPQQESKFELKEVKIQKKNCTKIICNNSIESKCHDKHGLDMMHVKQQDEYSIAFHKGVIHPLKIFKSSPQNVNLHFFDMMMENIYKLIELNIFRTKNEDVKNENAMIYLIECILSHRMKKNASAKLNKIIQKLIPKLENTMNDVEIYSKANTYDCVNMKIVGPAADAALVDKSEKDLERLEKYNKYLGKSSSSSSNAILVSPVLSPDEINTNTRDDIENETISREDKNENIENKSNMEIIVDDVETRKSTKTIVVAPPPQKNPWNIGKNSSSSNNNNIDDKKLNTSSPSIIAASPIRNAWNVPRSNATSTNMNSNNILSGKLSMANVLKSRQKETMQSFKTPRNNPMMSDVFKTKQKETISSFFNKTRYVDHHNNTHDTNDQFRSSLNDFQWKTTEEENVTSSAKIVSIIDGAPTPPGFGFANITRQNSFNMHSSNDPIFDDGSNSTSTSSGSITPVEEFDTYTASPGSITSSNSPFTLVDPAPEKSKEQLLETIRLLRTTVALTQGKLASTQGKLASTQKELEKKDGAVILLRSRLSSSSSTSEKDFEEKDREISILEKKLASCKLKLEAAKKEKEIVTEEKNALAAEKNALAADKMLLTRMINKLLTSAEKERDEPLW